MDSEIQYRLTVDGMTCSDCEQHVKEALEAIGTRPEEVSFRRGLALFWGPPDLSQAAVFQAVSDAGYRPVALAAEPSKAPVAHRPWGQDEFDLVVIGSGSAGLAAAIEARQAGARVAVVERGVIGGTCVNVGCVPSKTLLRASELYHWARQSPFPGLNTSAGSPHLETVIAEKDRLVATLRKEKYEDLLETYGILYWRGEAQFIDPRTIRVNDRLITAHRFLLATGARPYIPAIPGIDSVPYLTSTTALSLVQPPGHLVVIGAGYIALEFGQLFRRWGSAVTLIQRGADLLPEYDCDVRTVVRDMLASQGIEVVTGVQYRRVASRGSQIVVEVDINGRLRVIEGDALLVAAGRQPNTDGLALDVAGVATGSRGEPIVDETLQTQNPRIYAAGDVTMGPQFVYVAAYEGKVAARNALQLTSHAERIDLGAVPRVAFTHPAIAAVGMTEEAAARQGLHVRSVALPLDRVPRALVNRETEGIVKMVAEEGAGRIRGVQVVADNAGDVIYAAELAVKFGLTVRDLADTLAPYLTMAEGLKLAALAFDQDVTKLSCCAG
ncbi:MAG: mercury(II) reductase [Firmicutes bacterium]|nr:mercury(II) reductase [Bacillota bacterium]